MLINYSATVVYGNHNESPKGNYSTNNSMAYSSEIVDSTLQSELSSIKLMQRFINYMALSGNVSTAGKSISAAINGWDGLGAPTNS